MKRFLKYLLIIILFSFWGIVLTNKEQTREAVKEIYKAVIRPCSRPLEYSIGTVDLRFGISREDFIKLSQEAEVIWESPTGKNLFQYKDEAPFKISLIFDERQEKTFEADRLEDDLSDLKLSQEALEKQYESLHSVYEQKMSAYEKSVKEYERRLEKYNEDVEYWNERGGAPEDEYEDLEKERKKLKDLYSDLEKERSEVNKLAGKTNNLATKENQIVDEYNANLVTYKSKFGGTREFEKGIFDGQAINIYQFQEKSDLRLTISHELGHYLGLGHVNNPTSVMYYLIGEQDLENPELTAEDTMSLNSVCRLE